MPHAGAFLHALEELIHEPYTSLTIDLPILSTHKKLERVCFAEGWDDEQYVLGNDVN